ncbi:MAG: DUF2085 domain-containing protein [Syntrophorhabdus sp.]|nr:DUF2085 domain-containing protein [Syntrophorhabdus sp.]
MRLGVNRLGCHGIPSRCFSVRGKPLPFCSRCLGVGIGQMTAAVFLVAGIASLPGMVLSLALLCPMLLDWSLQEFAGIESNNYRRLATGILGGFGFVSVLVVVFRCVR